MFQSISTNHENGPLCLVQHQKQQQQHQHQQKPNQLLHMQQQKSPLDLMCSPPLPLNFLHEGDGGRAGIQEDSAGAAASMTAMISGCDHRSTSTPVYRHPFDSSSAPTVDTMTPSDSPVVNEEAEGLKDIHTTTADGPINLTSPLTTVMDRKLPVTAQDSTELLLPYRLQEDTSCMGGSHSDSELNLSTDSVRRRARDEIKVCLFVFPFGRFDNTTVSALIFFKCFMICLSTDDTSKFVPCE